MKQANVQFMPKLWLYPLRENNFDSLTDKVRNRLIQVTMFLPHFLACKYMTQEVLDNRLNLFLPHNKTLLRLEVVEN